MPALSPCLWFQREAEEAANYYVSLFPGSRVTSVMRAGPGPDAPAIAVEFELDGRSFLALNGRPERGFTDAHSFLIPCDSQQEIDRYWDALTDGGSEGRCGWLVDRFGVSWQVAPKNFAALLGGEPEQAARAMQAMMGMKKIDIAAMQRAREGAVAAR